MVPYSSRYFDDYFPALLFHSHYRSDQIIRHVIVWALLFLFNPGELLPHKKPFVLTRALSRDLYKVTRSTPLSQAKFDVSGINELLNMKWINTEIWSKTRSGKESILTTRKVIQKVLFHKWGLIRKRESSLNYKNSSSTILSFYLYKPKPIG